MPFPKKTCVVCGEEFELKPDKPGFANRCPECSVPEETKASANDELDPVERRTVAADRVCVSAPAVRLNM